MISLQTILTVDTLTCYLIGKACGHLCLRITQSHASYRPNRFSPHKRPLTSLLVILQTMYNATREARSRKFKRLEYSVNIETHLPVLTPTNSTSSPHTVYLGVSYDSHSKLRWFHPPPPPPTPQKKRNQIRSVCCEEGTEC